MQAGVGRESRIDRCGWRVVASRAVEPGAQCDGCDAERWDAHDPNPAGRWKGDNRNNRHWVWAHARGVRAHFYSLLHQQAAWNRAGTGDCAVGGERSRRKNQRAERTETRDNIRDRATGESWGAGTGHWRAERKRDRGTASRLKVARRTVATQSPSLDRRR